MSERVDAIRRAIRHARHGDCCRREYDRDRDDLAAAVRTGDTATLDRLAALYGVTP